MLPAHFPRRTPRHRRSPNPRTVPSDRCNTYELVDQVYSLLPVVKQLPARDRHVLHRRLVDHRTQAEIGAEIGVTQMQVSRLLHNIITQLQLALSA